MQKNLVSIGEFFVLVKMKRREYPSGAQKRKLAKQNEEEMKKNPKIDAFFKQTEKQNVYDNASECVNSRPMLDEDPILEPGTSMPEESKAKDLDSAKSVCELDAVLSKLKKHRQDFSSFLARSNDTARRWSIPTTFKQKRKAAVKFDDDIDPERIFKVKVFHGILDIMILQLESRFAGTKKITSLFKVVYPSSLLELRETEINIEVSRLVEAYPEDLSNALATELVMLKSSMSDKLKEMSSVRQLATCLLVDYKEVASSFPNICVLLRIFLTIPVTVASAERSFSKLKIIKN